MELQIKEYEQPAPIEFNFEELKNELTEKVAHYEALVYTDDQIKEAKADRANLNKLKKALNDERIRREKEYMEPFNDFKMKIGQIIAIIDKPIEVIDNQVKAYEEKCKAEKREEIEGFFDDTEAKPSWLTLDMIFEERWLNASVSIKNVQEEIMIKVNKVNDCLDSLSQLPEFSFEAIEVFKQTLDINKALTEGRRLADIQRRKEEQARLEAERQAEQEAREAERIANETEAAPTACQPAEPVNVWEGEERTWISFKALMTVEDALELKHFFEARGISYQPVKEGVEC